MIEMIVHIFIGVVIVWSLIGIATVFLDLFQ